MRQACRRTGQEWPISLVGVRSNVLEQTRMDTSPHASCPRLVPLGALEGGNVVEQHAECRE